MAKDPYMCETIPNSPPPPPTAWIRSHACVKPYLLPIPPPPRVPRQYRVLPDRHGYTVLTPGVPARTGFAVQARLIPPSVALRVGTER